MAQIEKIVASTRPGEDCEILRKAYGFSVAEHGEQSRLSGEPFHSHPLAVARILAEMKLDVTCIVAGMLHDVVEDTPTTAERITQEFGEEVAQIVEGVTKIGRIQFHSREEHQAENYRKMVLAMVDDIRVILVKLADRLHNMRTLNFLPQERQERTARETMEIYAPIAHRLGMGKVRGELEDLAFRYLESEAFVQLQKDVETRRKSRQGFLSQVQSLVKKRMKENKIPVRVEGRIKRTYSLYQKLKRQRIPIGQVYDLLAVRIITDKAKNCYAALGIVHNTWRPVPGRIKDFIAIPRPNMYQSLHTSLIGPNGQPFEIQIRTEEMHLLAEEGIAAHWKYKGTDSMAEQEAARFAWLRHLVEWQRDMRDPGEFLSTLKVDLYPEEVYAFTPQGKVIILPREATPIDFAYSIHTEVGHSCIGAKVNGRPVPLKSKLRNGNIVEILTRTGHMPSRDWLTMVKTSRARNKIKHWISVTERERAVEIGKKLLEREAIKCNLLLAEVTDQQLAIAAQDYGCTSSEALYAGIGYGRFGARLVLRKLAPTVSVGAGIQRASIRGKKVSAVDIGPAIQIHGHGDLMVYRSKCCGPIRGEEIVGYITRGKGIAVHFSSCPNVKNLIYESDRRIDVEWVGKTYEPYTVKLTLHTEDRQGLLAEVTSAISGIQSNIQNIEARTAGHDAVIDVTLDIMDRSHLDKVVTSLQRVNGVFDVERVMQA